MTPRTQRDKILAAIEHIDGEEAGGTVFSVALENAGIALAAKTDVENKHIIFITDGEPSAGDAERYKYWLQENAKKGITTSVIGVRCTTTAKNTITGSVTLAQRRAREIASGRLSAIRPIGLTRAAAAFPKLLYGLGLSLSIHFLRIGGNPALGNLRPMDCMICMSLDADLDSS